MSIKPIGTVKAFSSGRRISSIGDSRNFAPRLVVSQVQIWNRILPKAVRGARDVRERNVFYGVVTYAVVCGLSVPNNINMYVCVCMYLCIYLCIYVCIYVFMYVLRVLFIHYSIAPLDRRYGGCSSQARYNTTSTPWMTTHPSPVGMASTAARTVYPPLLRPPSLKRNALENSSVDSQSSTKVSAEMPLECLISVVSGSCRT